MTERLEFYKCNICGNLVQVILPGVGEPVCCGEKMELLEVQKTDNPELSEKHVPVFIDTAENGEEIRVGTTLHPMSDDHYIQFIETITQDKNCLHLKYYSPMDIPILLLKEKMGIKKAQAFCNIHGLWEGQND